LERGSPRYLIEACDSVALTGCDSVNVEMDEI
jgi:hypothetical protein